MQITTDDGHSITVDTIGTTSEGYPVVDALTALTIVEEWADARDVDESRGWTTPNNDYESAPPPFILAWLAPGSRSSIRFEEWPVLYDPDAGFWDSSAYSVAAFPFPLEFTE